MKRQVRGMRKDSRLVVITLMILAIFGVVGLSPAQALGPISVSTPTSVSTAVLRHTSHLLVSNIIGQAGDHSATVAWDAPAGIYADQVVAYKVVVNYKDPSTNKRVSTAPVTITDVTQRTATITGLMNGVWHDFTITAQSNTEWSAMNTNNVKNGGMVKPSGLPCAASAVTAVAGNKRVSVRWNRPCNGGATATFTLNAYSGSTLVATKTNIADNHTAPAATFTGLTNGISYTFTVTSTNANGSATGVSSSAVTPHS
jgi:hypothetical protein